MTKLFLKVVQSSSPCIAFATRGDQKWSEGDRIITVKRLKDKCSNLNILQHLKVLTLYVSDVNSKPSILFLVSFW